MSVASTYRRLLSSSSRVISQAATALPSSSSSTEAYIPPPLPQASTSSARRHVARQKLAKVEATRGGLVSPFLTDSFGREHDYLRISLTEKCNLRCTYCMPENGAPLSPKEHLLTSDEIVRLAGLFVKNGVRKIRLTGGEPTVRRDLAEIVERLSALGIDSLGMTSNGLALARKLPGLVDAGLTSLNISLDTLDEHKFELMTRRRGHSAVLNAIKQAASLHHTSSSSSSSTGTKRLKHLKLNVVVINGLNDAEVPAFVELTQDLPLSVRFIEYMPFSDNRWSTQKLVPSADLLARVSAQHPIGSIQAITPGISDTAREYRVEGYKGSFGFISSMTDHFCSGCSRLRIQADGGMKVCLFGAPKVSLRDLMRSGQSDAEIAQSIGIALKNKHFAHDGSSGPSDLANNAKGPMVLIGG